MKLENVEDIYPLYPMQQGMLFHSLDEVGTGIYFIQLACRMRGGMNPAAFRRAWEKVVERHPILRTAFLWDGFKQPVQVVRQRVDLPWHEEDWRGLPEAEQEDRWREFLREDVRRGFDFQQAPLMRLAMVRIADESYYFAWSTHHMLMDGWCSQIITGEVFKLYSAYCQGRELELERPPHYREYIKWLQKQDTEKAETFWRAELKGFTNPVRIGADLPERQIADGEEAYAKPVAVINARTSEKLEEFARGQQVTLNTLVQGAWALLLRRYTGEQDVLFGAPVSGRSADVPGIEKMIGLFINTLPVRVQVEDQEILSVFLRRLQARQAQARDFEFIPLIKVIESSEVRRGTDLFDTL